MGLGPVAVRTSRCNGSEKRLDDRSRDREREGFNELPLVLDKDWFLKQEKLEEEYWLSV
jgi:hypothetical protein